MHSAWFSIALTKMKTTKQTERRNHIYFSLLYSSHIVIIEIKAKLTDNPTASMASFSGRSMVIDLNEIVRVTDDDADMRVEGTKYVLHCAPTNCAMRNMFG